MGLAPKRDTLAGSLSYGEQRMLEFARALATRPRLLLVDEPAAGLNAAEVDTLLDRILITRDRGVTVVLVEHNMGLVMNVADRVLVMDYGQHLFEGVPAEVQKSEAVLAAYLGGELMWAHCSRPRTWSWPMAKSRYAAASHLRSTKVKSSH